MSAIQSLRGLRKTICLWAACLEALASCSYAATPHAYSLSGDYWGTHDPSIAKEGNTWYVFATGKAPDGGQIAIRCSEDLAHWRFCGHVFDRIPDWITNASPNTRDLWAPDIAYYKGEYRLYYAYSFFGKNTSGIALATNRTLDPASPDYRWVDKGLVLRSVAGDNYNAIDPNFSVDQQGRCWLAFGSFWSGIKMRLLNSEGKLATEDAKLYSLATRKKPTDAMPAKPGQPARWQAVEAPFIARHHPYYYLFVSWDLCCRGNKSTYRIMVGRSSAITGPYRDRAGTPMMEGGGTQVLVGNQTWVGPGGESVFIGKKRDLLVFHAYDAKTGKPALQLSTLTWSGGWPQAALESEPETAAQK